MRITLRFIGKDADDLRFFILADGRHAGGVTVHSVRGTQFSYGIAIAPAMRRRGIASLALPQLFERMARRGFECAVVRVAPNNAASLALHRALGFEETGHDDGSILLTRPI